MSPDLAVVFAVPREFLKFILPVVAYFSQHEVMN